MSELYKMTKLRKIALPLLKCFSFDFWMRHPWLHDQKIFLNSFKHKGYWYHGRNRELKTMELFYSLIPQKSVVVEVGGHIGFISQYFRSLVGGVERFMSLSQAQTICRISEKT